MFSGWNWLFLNQLLLTKVRRRVSDTGDDTTTRRADNETNTVTAVFEYQETDLRLERGVMLRGHLFIVMRL